MFKKITLTAVSLLFLQNFSSAERFIVINPKSDVARSSLAVTKIREIKFGNKTFSVVENNGRASSALIKATLQADAVVRDLPIELVNVAPSGANDGDDDTKIAWHVNELEYENIKNLPNGKGVIVAV